MRPRTLVAGVLLGALVVSTLAGCEKLVRNMYRQPKYNPLVPSPLFPDGGAARPSVPGTEAHSEGVLAATSSGRAGADALVARERIDNAQANPFPVTAQLLERGRQRFNIYCAPCHSALGDGDGMVARRGFPHPPSYHTKALRNAPDRHFYDVITSGYGVMYSYADRVEPADRWAIVAYIRALQRSQNATLADVPRDAAARLGSQAR